MAGPEASLGEAAAFPLGAWEMEELQTMAAVHGLVEVGRPCSQHSSSLALGLFGFSSCHVHVNSRFLKTRLVNYIISRSYPYTSVY